MPILRNGWWAAGNQLHFFEPRYRGSNLEATGGPVTQHLRMQQPAGTKGFDRATWAVSLLTLGARHRMACRQRLVAVSRATR